MKKSELKNNNTMVNELDESALEDVNGGLICEMIVAGTALGAAAVGTAAVVGTAAIGGALVGAAVADCSRPKHRRTAYTYEYEYEYVHETVRETSCRW